MDDTLKNQRAKLGYSKKEMADKLKTKEITIWQYETNKRFPHPTKLWLIKDKYELTDEQFLNWIKNISKEGEI